MDSLFPTDASLRRTPLFALHEANRAKTIAFGGWTMPLSYPEGVIAECQHTRQAASLFDVSHMGQAIISGVNAAARLETLTPADLCGLAPGRARYSFLLNDDGNILDDLIVTRLVGGGAEGESFYFVLNAANAEADLRHLRAHLPELDIKAFDDRALLAIQGPHAETALARFAPSCAQAPFMSMRVETVNGASWFVSRCGYTGEDGFEISLPASEAVRFAEQLSSDGDVKWAGLAARDALRLEAGLCLHGHDIDATTSPVEAGLEWAIPARRRNTGGFPGFANIRDALDHGVARKRVGLSFAGRQPVREGAEVTTLDGEAVGTVTSGGFSPTLNRPIAMGYVAADRAAPGTALLAHVRGKALEAVVAPLPFVPHRYKARALQDRALQDRA